MFFSDHKNLKWILSGTRETIGKAGQDKLAWWARHLSSFDTQIVHIQGVHNVLADLLSRWGAPSPVEKVPQQATRIGLLQVSDSRCGVVSHHQLDERVHFATSFLVLHTWAAVY